MSEQDSPLRIVTISYARTHFCEIARLVAAGQVVAISKYGKVVAWMQPHGKINGPAVDTETTPK